VTELARTLETSNLDRSRAGARHLMGHPAVSAVAMDPRMLALARQFLGGSAIPYKATLFDKSLVRNWLVVWHQDTALPLRERREVPGWGPWSTKAGITYAYVFTVHSTLVLKEEMPSRSIRRASFLVQREAGLRHR
jgi:hypothetical protein